MLFCDEKDLFRDNEVVEDVLFCDETVLLRDNQGVFCDTHWDSPFDNEVVRQ